MPAYGASLGSWAHGWPSDGLVTYELPRSVKASGLERLWYATVYAEAFKRIINRFSNDAIERALWEAKPRQIILHTKTHFTCRKLQPSQNALLWAASLDLGAKLHRDVHAVVASSDHICDLSRPPIALRSKNDIHTIRGAQLISKTL